MAQVANTFENFDRVFTQAFDWYKRSPRHERERIAHTFRVVCRPTRRMGTVDLHYLRLVLRAVLPLFQPRYAPLLTVPTLDIFPAFLFHGEIAHYRPSSNQICFNENYLNRVASEIENTMKHELLHAWLHQNGFGNEVDCHGPHFRAMAKYLGIK